MSILEVQNLKKTFEDKETKVLKDISFTLEKGEVLSIIGSSGSGKTTLLRCLNLLTMPSEGVIRVNGETVYDSQNPEYLKEKKIREARLHFGFVFQSFNLFPQYTAIENIMLTPKVLAAEKPDFKAHKNEIYERIEKEAHDLIAKVGLLDRMNHYPHELSGGQQQRIAIARALAMKPDILCFDEPTSALDPELTGEVLKVIKELADMQSTMIIVTHEMSFARDVSSQILFMDQGYIVEKGNAKELIENPKEERTKQFLARYNNE